jgi:hypothetical protein
MRIEQDVERLLDIARGYLQSEGGNDFDQHLRYPRVVAICQYVLRLLRMSELPRPQSEPLHPDYFTQVIELQELAETMAVEYRGDLLWRLDKGVEAARLELERLRNRQQDVNTAMCQMFKGLIERCLEVLLLMDPDSTIDHNKYCVFAMGSLALGTGTPWSDLEFGVLLSDTLNEKQRSQYTAVFKKLTSILCIQVLKLGETILPSMDIRALEQFFDNLMPRGVSIDGFMLGARKTPLGSPKETDARGKTHRAFSLICTIPQLRKYQSAEWYKSEPQLAQALLHPRLLCGNGTLLQDYLYALGTKKRQVIALNSSHMLQEDLKKYHPVFSQIALPKSGYDLNVKKGVYRLIDRIIVSLRDTLLPTHVRYNDTLWKMLERLKDRNKISQIVHDNLLKALEIAVALRTNAYTHYQGQIETMLVTWGDVPTPLMSLNREDQVIYTIGQHTQVQQLNEFYHIMVAVFGALSSKNYSDLRTYTTLRRDPYTNVLIRDRMGANDSVTLEQLVANLSKDISVVEFIQLKLDLCNKHLEKAEFEKCIGELEKLRWLNLPRLSSDSKFTDVRYALHNTYSQLYQRLGQPDSAAAHVGFLRHNIEKFSDIKLVEKNKGIYDLKKERAHELAKLEAKQLALCGCYDDAAVAYQRILNVVSSDTLWAAQIHCDMVSLYIRWAEVEMVRKTQLMKLALEHYTTAGSFFVGVIANPAHPAYLNALENRANILLSLIDTASTSAEKAQYHDQIMGCIHRLNKYRHQAAQKLLLRCRCEEADIQELYRIISEELRQFLQPLNTDMVNNQHLASYYKLRTAEYCGQLGIYAAEIRGPANPSIYLGLEVSLRREVQGFMHPETRRSQRNLGDIVLA